MRRFQEPRANITNPMIVMNTSEMGMRFGGYAGQCPVAESVSDRLLRLPFYNNLTDDDQREVIDAIHSWRR